MPLSCNSAIQLLDNYLWSFINHYYSMLFPENIDSNLSVDKTALIDGEFYTIIINKVAKGRKGAFFVMLQGTRPENIILILKKNP